MFQEAERFYYGFNEKIPLVEVDNKLVVRYSESISKDIASNALTRTYATVQQTWKDDRTVVLSTGSKADRNTLMENLQGAPEVNSCQPMYAMNTGLEMIVTDEIVVKFKEHIRAEQQQEINQKFAVTQVKDGDTYLLLRVPKGIDALSIANQYQESGYVEFSHPNFIVKFDTHQQVIPNDPYFVNQFTLNNTGQVFNDGHFGTADADIDAPEAWAMTTGANNILVAVLDQGVSPNHPDLPNARQVRLNGSNFADGNPNDPTPTGNTNHGNACAGVIAATQNNNEGIAGICPNCRIMPIRIFDSFENAVSTNLLADAINFARTNGADIISNSWGADVANPNFAPVIVTAIQTATTQGRVINGVARGCVVLFSAGNNPTNNGIVHFPANVNVAGVLTVGASDRNDFKSFYSPLGNPASPNNQLLDVTAPSHRAYPFQIAGETFEAWTIDIPGNTGYNPWPQFTSPGNLSVVPPAIGEQLPNAGANFQAYTGRFGGTSHSCPVVAGVAALVLTANPNLTQQQVFNIITGTADQVGGYVYTNGRSNELGFGRVNACQAVLSAFETAMTVSGPSLVCISGGTFTLNNAPAEELITWQLQNGGKGITPSSGTGAAATISIPEFFIQGPRTIIFTINTGCGNIQVSKTFYAGENVSIGNTQLNYNPQQPCPLDKYYSVPYLPGVTYQWNVTGPYYTTWFHYGENPPNYQENAIYVLTTTNAPFNISVTMSADGCTVTGTMTNQSGNGIYCDCYYDPYVCPEQEGGWGLFNVYPNPATNYLEVAVDENEFESAEFQSYEIVLLDNMGIVQMRTSTDDKLKRIDTSPLKNGHYILQILYKGNKTQGRIIIDR